MNDFEKLVQDMREKQRAFFQSKTQSAMQAKRDAEKKVDAWLAKRAAGEEKQGKLV